MMGLNLMKPALGKKKENDSDEVSHGSPVFLICDGDSTVSLASSPPFFWTTATKQGWGWSLSPWKHPPRTNPVGVLTRRETLIVDGGIRSLIPPLKTLFFLFLSRHIFFRRCLKLKEVTQNQKNTK